MKLTLLLCAAVAICGGFRIGAAEPATQPAVDSAWLTGMWIHQRTDKPGSQEPTHYILQLGADGSWVRAGLWGTPHKPVKAVVYDRRTGWKLARLGADWDRVYPGSEHWLPKPEYSLSLPHKDGSLTFLGTMARKDADTIIFHNFCSIHWANDYAKASPPIQESLQGLLKNAPTPISGGGRPVGADVAE